MKKLKYTHYNIVFQEVPNETTLVFNISGCPYKCEGCHSTYLWEYKGEFLLENINEILSNYKNFITCVCFMGGDQNSLELYNLLRICQEFGLKTCLYTGKDFNSLEEIYALPYFNYLNFIKVGHYDKNLGGLNNPQTNQRFYKIEYSRLIDITETFQKKYY